MTQVTTLERQTADISNISSETDDRLLRRIAAVRDDESDDWRYSPDRIEAFYRNRPFEVAGRFLQILIAFSSYFLAQRWDRFTGQTEAKQRRRAIQLREILTKLGPAYIKVGQALSTRPDVVPPVALEELTKLQDQLPPFPNEIAYRFIEEELGAPPDEIYAELSPTPIAAASLGQVYQGKLKTGEVVAVKVQRPDLEKCVTLDIYIMRQLATWVQNNVKQVRSNLVAIADELASRIFEEMNYAQEGRNAEKFAQLYGHMPEIYVPKIYWEYTGKRVLTMEWITGTKLTNIQEVQAKGINATHLVEVGVECSLRQLLENGFFHADPHPGNLLAMSDGRLAYLDFGMMSTILPYQRYGLVEAIVHLVNRDFDALAYDYVKLDFLNEDTDLRPIVPALTNVFGNALGASVAELNFKSITDQMSAMMYEFPFRVPAYYALIIRSMVTLEGIAIGIEPDFKVLSKAYPYVAKRLLTDPSPELRSSLKDLLFKDGSFRWNRLENLLKNARDSVDYDFPKLVNQTVEYIFSDRGIFIRERLVEEVINAVDTFGRQSLYNFTVAVRQQIGLAVNEDDRQIQAKISNNKSNNNNSDETLERLQIIWQILQDTPGFDPISLMQLLPQLAFKSETQDMAKKIAEGLLQKIAVRLIRALLLEPEVKSI
jgi:predicted unusual protein kinase regulating ubiquinone biosynthesis (AarF/ABC1/UbiB family)